MKKTIRLDDEAEEEIAHAIDHYENEREGLGTEFWTELSGAIDELAAPGVFVESDAVVRVISVMHGHRRPAYGQRRLS